MNGSLRGAPSLEFLQDVESRLPDTDNAKTTISVKAKVEGGCPVETLRDLAAADAVILVFPLYTFVVPGAPMRVPDDYSSHVRSGGYHNRGPGSTRS